VPHLDGRLVISIHGAISNYRFPSLMCYAATPVHPKNWYPIPLIFCKPWGILPSDVPCHPKLADFANCMKKKGRGMSIFASIVEGDYEEKAEESRVVLS
jgi:potassium/chloride transporter 4/5/6